MLAAVKEGDVKLAELIRQDPGFKVNMDQDGDGFTLLHFACLESRRSAVIPLLLAHPGINPNLKDRYGTTPFLIACGGHISCVLKLLQDSKVKVNEPHNNGYTPLHWAAFTGRLDVIEWWIASGRDLNFGTQGDIYTTDAIGGAREAGKTEVVTLLERFKSDPAKTRSAVRRGLGINGQYHSFFLFPHSNLSFV